MMKGQPKTTIEAPKFDPWIVMTRKKRIQVIGKASKLKDKKGSNLPKDGNSNGGSRFVSLAEVHDQDDVP